jgi:putative hydrolase of the HAD superfamily
LRVEPSVGAVYAEEAARVGLVADAQVLDAAFRAEWRDRPLSTDGRSPFAGVEDVEKAWWRELVRRVFARLDLAFESDEAFELFYETVFERFGHPEVWRVYDDVAETLETLCGRGVRRAVVSNWDSRLPVLLRRMGLGPHFEFVLTSAEAGWRKPHPRIFQLALRRLGLAADQVLYVGDSEEDDVKGARGAGMRCVLVDRSRPDSTSNGVIRSLLRLVEAIRPSSNHIASPPST